MRQSGYRVKITVQIPFDRKDPASLKAALADVEALEAAGSLCKLQGITMDIEAAMTSWEIKTPAQPVSEHLAPHPMPANERDDPDEIPAHMRRAK